MSSIISKNNYSGVYIMQNTLVMWGGAILCLMLGEKNKKLRRKEKWGREKEKISSITR